jgi:hypothetical protein
MTTILIAANRFALMPTARMRVRFVQLLISQVRYQRALRTSFAPAAEQFYRVDSSLLSHPNFR